MPEFARRSSNKEGIARRSGTRIPCEIPITLTSTELVCEFSEPCVVVLVNPQGCAARFARALDVGTRVKLEGLPCLRDVTAEVVNCISMGEFEKFWLLGLSLHHPGNVWGISVPPSDWTVES